jgi:hypothetical protein
MATWEAMPWDVQQVYLDGLDADKDIPFQRNQDAGGRFGGGEAAPGMDGPTIRENVDIGVQVIDLAKMRAELEADPRSRKQW